MKVTIQILRGFGAFTRIITEGKVFQEKPLRAFVNLSAAEKSIICVGFAVSKNVRRAVDRNLLRRYMRESFRQHKEILAGRVGKEMMVSIVFMYSGRTERPLRQKGNMQSITIAMRKMCEKVKTGYV